MLRLERPLNPFEKECPVPEDFTDARLVRLLEYWRAASARAGDGLPPVSAIDPTQLRFIIGWLMVMEPIDGGADFKYRLYGTEIASVTRRELTGCKLSDSFPIFAAWASERYRAVMAHKRPLLTRHSPQRFVAVDQWERLILPFVDASGAVTRLVVGAVITGKIKGAEDSGLPWPLKDHGKTA